MQAMNYFIYPFQLALYIPLMIKGAQLLDPAQQKLSFGRVWSMIRHDVWDAVQQLFWANLGAILIWASVAFPVAAILFPVLRYILRNLHRKYRKE
jgi:hypothetical protein